MIGPFWITLSMGIMIGTLGVLYSKILKTNSSDYLPYLATGLFTWGLISNLINDGCRAFNSGGNLIKQLSAPLSIHIFRELWSNALIAAHNILVVFVVLLVFHVNPGWVFLLVIPGFFFILINGFWVGLLLGLISARFRDIPLIVASVVQVTFFLTPILWMPDMLPERHVFLDANPFYHFTEIVRGPMLGKVPTIENFIVVVIVTLVGWAVALLFYTAYRRRLAYWV